MTLRALLRSVAGPASIAALLALGGCTSDCEKLVDHTVELAKKEGLPEDKVQAMTTEDARSKAVKLCTREPTSAVECALAAESLEALKACKPKEKQQ